MFKSLKSQKITTILIKKYVSTNEKKNLPKKYFINVMVIQYNVLRDFGTMHSFCVPNCECTQLLLYSINVFDFEFWLP
jgi:hypothetical protein